MGFLVKEQANLNSWLLLKESLSFRSPFLHTYLHIHTVFFCTIKSTEFSPQLWQQSNLEKKSFNKLAKLTRPKSLFTLFIMMAFFSVFLLPPTKKHNIQSLPILDFLKVLFKYCPYSILPYCSFFFFSSFSFPNSISHII